MKFTLKRLALVIAGAGALALYGCGGGDGTPVATTTAVPVTVIDGAIKNAMVCLDKNNNGACDSGEPSGQTDGSGKVTLQVDPADVGKFPILALVGTDAIDTDPAIGQVMVAYTLKAPADKSAVVSPLTTLVQTLIEGAGLSSTVAETQVKAQTGINVSLFDDFTQGTSADSMAAKTMARLVVITTQEQIKKLDYKNTIGKMAIDGSKINKENLDKAIQKRMLERLANLKTAATDPAVISATTPKAKEDALLAQATTLVTTSDLTVDSIATVVAVNNQVVTGGTDTATALAQAKTFLTVFDSSLATAIPGTGATNNAFSDACYLGGGYTKAVSIALFDADPMKAVAGDKYRIGSTRTNVQVLADRASTNPDGSSRRELDIKYQINYTDGTVHPGATETLISGSSAGSMMAPAQACATPQTGSNWRFYGDRSVVNAGVRSWNTRNERYSLATGAPVTGPSLVGGVDYSKYIQFRIADPSNFAKYVVITGPGIPSTGYKMLSPRILRDDPLLAGKRGNYVDWRDTDPFRFCRGGTDGAANIADCVTNGASGNNAGSFYQTAAAADTAFDALGFKAGGAYTVAVYNDDGWKTVNGQAAQTPIATYTRTLGRLPYSAVALAGSGVTSDLYPRITSSLSAVDKAAAIRAKTSFTTNLSWTALGALPDSAKFVVHDLYTYEEGRTARSTNTNFWPASRPTLGSNIYPAAGATSLLNYMVPAPSGVLLTPTYGEFGIEATDRIGAWSWIASIVSFQ